jgi:hypothetical protein
MHANNKQRDEQRGKLHQPFLTHHFYGIKGLHIFLEQKWLSISMDLCLLKIH